MSDSYQREITDFLVGYGATAIAIVSGGKHPKVEFDFRGKRIAYTIASSPSDHRASANAIGSLKKMLGEPVVEAETERRRLDDMLPEAVERPTFPGKLALYETKASSPMQFRFFVPKALVDRTGLSLGQAFSVAAIDQHTWHFHLLQASEKGTPTLKSVKEGEGYVVRVSAPLLTKMAPFGLSPADYSIVGDGMLVHLDANSIRPLHRTGYLLREQMQPGAIIERHRTASGAEWVEPAAPAVAAPPVVLAIGSVADRLRALLASIQLAERETGYRLIKLRRDDKSEGEWTWRAPDIRLE